MKPPANTALWLTAKRAAWEVAPAPYTAPRPNEIVIKNHAIAMNPVDWMMQPIGGLIFPWIKYPFILGSDVAGEVIEVGSAVTHFRSGDRVVGHAVGADKMRNAAAESGFQNYTVLLAHMAAPIPEAMPYENAVVLPLGLSTAACGLFQKDQLALAYPSAHPEPQHKTLLIWGGSTSVGSNAIQLAVAAGYDVITTASPRNFDYVKALGAHAVFDYRSASVVADVIAALQDRTCAGALAIGIGSAEACLAVVHACRGNKAVAIATPSVSFDTAPEGKGGTLWLIRTIGRLMAANIPLMTKAQLRGIRTKFIFGSSLQGDEVGPMIYRSFLPDALAEGRYAAAPDPMVVGRGLDKIVSALDHQKKGVSAKKVVVLL